MVLAQLSEKSYGVRLWAILDCSGVVLGDLKSVPGRLRALLGHSGRANKPRGSDNRRQAVYVMAVGRGLEGNCNL